MEGRNVSLDRSEAAGHLLAELHLASDQFRHGRITARQLSERIAVIRKARLRVMSAFASQIDQMSLRWDALMDEAKGLKTQYQSESQLELVH